VLALLGLGVVLCLASDRAAATRAPQQTPCPQQTTPCLQQTRQPRQPQQASLAVLSAAGPLALTGRAPATFASGVSTIRELVGQRFVVAMSGTSPSSALLARVRRGEIGGVILFEPNIVSPAQVRRLTSALQQAAREAGRPPLLIATDQEGGRIRRLPWAGPVPSTVELGRLGTSRIRAEATASGKALRSAGVNVDLAPVGDLSFPRSFMALEQRTFASSPSSVAAATVAFARGLATSRVAAVAKHFPGIGRATRNTDRAAVEIAATRVEMSRSDLLPFRAAIDAGIPIVMISNATYPALDTKPAPWSTRIQSLLRRELGFAGVTISDALDGAAATRGRPLPSVAALAAEAGVDLLLFTGSEASSAAAFEHVVRIAERGRISAATLQASYGRIMELKRAYK
jgi:beta-N-acetylhexosaminidase